MALCVFVSLYHYIFTKNIAKKIIEFIVNMGMDIRNIFANLTSFVAGFSCGIILCAITALHEEEHHAIDATNVVMHVDE